MTNGACARGIVFVGGLVVLGLIARPVVATPGSGPDVVYTNISGINHYGPVGGIHAYALGSHTCNIGNQNLLWLNDGTPGLGMNAYRLEDGRIEQIGLSWVKHACCAAAGNGCDLTCNGQGGSVLGAGCRDVYSAGWNSIQSNLGPRSGINAFSGDFSPIGGSGANDIDRRLQVRETEMDAAAHPDALFFAEGSYVGTDDAAAGNALNNASYKHVTIDSGFGMTGQGFTEIGSPAIFAWQDHGLGLGTPDPDVHVIEVDVPDEGRFFIAGKTSDNGDGSWHYEYAVFNLNSDRSGGTFIVPVPAAVTVTNEYFHDVDYHSGESYDPTDWSSTRNAEDVTWSSPQTHDQNPDSNALRWGTMYNFGFDADAAPGDGAVTLGLFKPGTPASVEAILKVPGGKPCPADLDGNGAVAADDLLLLLGSWGTADGDVTGDGDTNVDDLLVLLAAWGPCP